MKRTLTALVAVVLTGCTPADLLVGSYNVTLSGLDTTTAPGMSTSTPSGTGTVAITHGIATDYVLLIGQTTATACQLTGKKNKDKAQVIDIAAGQVCQFSYSTGTVTATLTSGSVTLDASTMNTASLALSYSYTGSVFGINYAGTGNRTYAGPRF